ncbi:MAG: ATP-dependent RecD-like DNA helicase [Clostridia bacterium]|nr:ATP-dependent RecD-like DNA helicase [Clostridia bacterium]
MTISGKVYDIIYQNQENGYTVCEIDSASDGLVTLTGYMPYISEGEDISATGVFANHPEYGEQFRVSYYETILPTDESSILDYLSSGIIYGIRAKTAEKIVNKFGADSLNILLTDPMRLSEIKGISAQKAEKIGQSYLELQSVQSILMFCQQYGISTNLAFKVHKTLGSGAISQIQENPYVLSDRVEGISFKTADNIATIRGIPKNSPMRIKAGIKYIIDTLCYSQGHTYLPKEMLISNSEITLGVTREEVENGITSLELEHQLYSDVVNKEEVYYLDTFYQAEQYVARRIASLSSYPPTVSLSEKEILPIIDNAEKSSGILLDDRQKEAVLASFTSGCVVITGGPGTGKTTTINTIIKALSEMQLSIALTAPTGRAAKRMSQVTGLEAKTIHRLLCVKPADDSDVQHFLYNESNPLPFDVIIMDEVSMVDIQLMNAFLRAVKRGARVIFSGDADQLPSVGPGNVLRDIIDSGIVPVIHLSTIFRQAQESLIVMNAHKINCGEMPDLATHDKDFFFLSRPSSESVCQTVIDLYKTRLPASYSVNPMTSIQVLSPSKKGVAGTINLNRELQLALNPPSILKQEYAYGNTLFRVGDKVMQIKNDYDIIWTKPTGETGSGIFNGDMGIIESISVKDRVMTVIFDDERECEYTFSDLDKLDLAYAVTVHKSQGSEFPIIIMPVCHFAPMLMCRNLLYTAVTRAKTIVVLVGSQQATQTMVENNDEKKRFTGLLGKLKAISLFTISGDNK